MKTNFFIKKYFFILQLLVVGTSFCTDGTLDPSFGTGGKVTTAFAGLSEAQAIIIQPDNKLVAVGFVNNGATNFDFALARYLTNGSLDTTFGTGGLVTTNFTGTSSDQASAALIQTDNKIVAAGFTLISGGNNDFALARYNTNGTIDTTFGTNGIVITNISGTSNDFVQALLLQPDNKIVAVGYTSAAALFHFALTRYNTNGTLDTTFGTNGIVTTNFSGTSTDQARAAVLQPDNKIVAVGNSNVAGTTDFALARYNTNGTIDTTFGVNGKVTTTFTVTSSDQANAALIQPDGKIIAVGFSNGTSTGNIGFALARYNTTGSIDTTFGTGGKVTTNFSLTSTDEAQAAVLQPNGKIVAIGFSNASGNNDFALARYNSNGTLDMTFGTNGLVTTNFTGSTSDQAFAGLQQPDGKLVAAGISNNNFALARYFDCPGVSQVGSDSVAIVFNTQQFVISGGRFAKLALLNAGFGLCGNGTFDSCFPVIGPLCLECHTLTLKQDLILNNTSSFGSLGNINGNGHVLELAKNMGSIAAVVCGTSTIGPAPACTSIEWGNLTLALNNDVLLQDVLITFTGNSVINGQGNALTLDSNSSIIIDKEANLLLKNLVIYGVQGNNIRCVDTLSTVSLANVAWVLDSNYSFTIGSLDVLEEFSISGPSNSFNYQSGQGSTIWAEGVMKIEYGVTFNYSPSTASKNLLSLSASTSELELNGGTLKASAVGMNLLRGLLTIKGASTLQSLGANQSQGISLGDGLSSSNNLTVHITPAAQLVIQGPVVSNDA